MRPMILFLFSLLALTAFSQAPEKISYQAVIRNSSDEILIETQVGVQISILKNLSTGKVVYTEQRTVATNANGLMTLEIGTGTSNANFSDIPRHEGPFYIRTDIDPEGGSTYTLSAISEILSVPYALHAGTADNISDPQTIFTPGEGIEIDGNVIKVKTDSLMRNKYEIGDLAQGGVVFWVDESGYHGLVCALIQINNTKLIWMDISFHNRYRDKVFVNIPGTVDGFVGSGRFNTALIADYDTTFKQPDEINYSNNGLLETPNLSAVEFCTYFQFEQDSILYTDWYLPSIYELELLFENHEIINEVLQANDFEEISRDTYWSSNQTSPENAYIINFHSQGYELVPSNKSDNIWITWPVRQF